MKPSIYTIVYVSLSQSSVSHTRDYHLLLLFHCVCIYVFFVGPRNFWPQRMRNIRNNKQKRTTTYRNIVVNKKNTHTKTTIEDEKFKPKHRRIMTKKKQTTNDDYVCVCMCVYPLTRSPATAKSGLGANHVFYTHTHTNCNIYSYIM